MNLCEDAVIPAWGKVLIKTGITIAIPGSNFERIAPRSGMSCRTHIDVCAGVIDAEYFWEIGVIMFGHSDKNLKMIIKLVRHNL